MATRRGRPATMSGRAGLVGILAAAAIALQACVGSGFTYVANGATHAYFKVPTNWTEFGKFQVLPRSGPETSDSASSATKWYVAFDADPSPSATHVQALLTGYPVLVAQVVQLDPVQWDGFSAQSIRNALLPVDQLLQQDRAKLVSSKDVVLSGGVNGNQIVVDVVSSGVLNAAADSDVLRMNQIGLVDPATKLLYLFSVRCSLACYAANKTLINEIADSWTVKEP